MYSDHNLQIDIRDSSKEIGVLKGDCNTSLGSSFLTTRRELVDMNVLIS